MNLAGLTDSVRPESVAAEECPRCHHSSRISHGLCLTCLLDNGVAPLSDDEPDEFETVLAAVNVSDTHWRIGQYEVLEEIGRGGMGVIYRARQRHSRRIIALKRLLSYQAQSRETLARFRREAEAAASLDHPNILPIYEVGESEDAIPYFTMKYAARGSLQHARLLVTREPREIIKLMVKVTRALQYAHGEGILHRDLKPGNILLDARGEPMVSDFGLAKWLNNDKPSELTRTLTVFGTPGYIAPEQMETPASQLTPAADIYSLGAILFDLLSGRPPFIGEHALAVLHQATEKSAPKLSSLVTHIDKDLETICARCLERQPSARYASAGDLLDDLERWLEYRPIIARPVSAPARVIRWSKRNPMLAGAAAVVAALLVALSGLFAWQSHNSRLAKAEVAKLRQGIMQFAQTEAQICEPGEKQRQEEVYLELSKQLGIDVALLRGKLPPFAAALKGSSGASSYERANAAYVAQDYAEAERWALVAATEARKATPPNKKAITQALKLAGLSAQAAIQYPRAMQYLREAASFSERSRDSEEWATLHDAIANLLFAQGDYAQAEKLFRDVIDVRSRALGSEHPDTLASRHRLIYVLNEEEKHGEAETEAREVLSLRERILGAEHPDTLLSRYIFAAALYHSGKYKEAEHLYRQVAEADERVIGPEHPRTLAAEIGLANALNDQGKYDAAIATYRKVIALDNKVHGAEHPVTLNDRMDLATALQAHHDYRGAESEYREVISLQQKTLGPEHAYTLNTRNNLAELLDDEENFAAAESECREILGLEERVVGLTHRLTLNTRANLAVALIGQGKVQEGETEVKKVVPALRETLGESYPDTVNFTCKFVDALARQQQIDEAISLAQEAEDSAQRNFGAEHEVTQRYAAMLETLRKRR
jgi:serine/threonine protein kinase